MTFIAYCLFQDCDTQHLETDPGNPWSQENMHLLPDYLHCIQVMLYACKKMGKWSVGDELTWWAHALDEGQSNSI